MYIKTSNYKPYVKYEKKEINSLKKDTSETGN